MDGILSKFVGTQVGWLKVKKGEAKPSSAGAEQSQLPPDQSEVQKFPLHRVPQNVKESSRLYNHYLTYYSHIDPHYVQPYSSQLTQPN